MSETSTNSRHKQRLQFFGNTPAVGVGLNQTWATLPELRAWRRDLAHRRENHHLHYAHQPLKQPETRSHKANLPSYVQNSGLDPREQECLFSRAYFLDSRVDRSASAAQSHSLTLISKAQKLRDQP